jgi:hypothetical protein
MVESKYKPNLVIIEKIIPLDKKIIYCFIGLIIDVTTTWKKVFL